MIELIRTGGFAAGSSLTTGTTEPWVVPFDAGATPAIVAFLGVLDQSFAR